MTTLVIAHRGASGYAPENTMAAFELAARQGADMCELDVQRSADGVLFVFHDDTVERWDGTHRLAHQLTFSQLQKLDIAGEKVPTLAEVANFARERGMQLNVEIKQPEIGAEVVQVLRDARATELTLISSFVPQALAEVGAAAKDIPLAYLMGTQTYRPDVRLREFWPFQALQQLHCQAWHPAWQIPGLAFVAPRVRRAGYRVNVWTVNDPVQMRRLLNLGVDGIITDTPDVLRRVMEQVPRVQPV